MPWPPKQYSQRCISSALGAWNKEREAAFTAVPNKMAFSPKNAKLSFPEHDKRRRGFVNRASRPAAHLFPDHDEVVRRHVFQEARATQRDLLVDPTKDLFFSDRVARNQSCIAGVDPTNGPGP